MSGFPVPFLEGFCIVEVLFNAEEASIDYRFLEVNPAFAAQTGLRDARGKRMRALAPDHEEHWFEIYGKVALTGEAVHFVNEAKALNRWYDVRAYRVGEPDERRVAICFNDITDLRRAEAAIRESEEKAHARAGLLEAVLDTIADGVIVYDVEGRTVRSSPAADTILGIPVGERQEAVGARVMRQYEILTEDGRPQTREEMIAVRAAVHGETVPNALYSVRSGDAPARWLNIGGKPLFLSGQHAGGVISMTDMTERKLAEMELALITRLYAVLSRVNEAIVRIRDERSLYEEVCRIVSKEGGVTIGAITLYAATANSFTDQQVALIESLCADVSFALEAMQQERLRSAAEEQLRLANASLRDADARKDEFLAMLSHELRNPLAPIRNAVHILRHAAPGSAQTIRAQDIIERQAMHMARIVDDLLDVTRIARGKIQLRPSRIELRALVARAAEDFRSLLQDHAVGFEVVLPAGNLWAEADPTRITQVIGNLLHNAAKFTQEVVLCDLGLPGMDGFEVARALRATGPQGLRLIAVSGYGLPEDIRQTLAAGFDSHIIKPSDPEEIIRQVGAGRIARARP